MDQVPEIGFSGNWIQTKKNGLWQVEQGFSSFFATYF